MTFSGNGFNRIKINKEKSVSCHTYFSFTYIFFYITLFSGVDITNKKKEDAGPILADRLRQIMQDLKMPDGLASLGYTSADIPALVKGTLPQVTSRNSVQRFLFLVTRSY